VVPEQAHTVATIEHDLRRTVFECRATLGEQQAAHAARRQHRLHMRIAQQPGRAVVGGVHADAEGRLGSP
jgi:hypothetical protein